MRGKEDESDRSPWTGKDEWRVLFQLASFAKDQSGADGVIAVFLKGPYAKLGWVLPPELYPKMPTILGAASHDSLRELAWVISEPGVQLPDEVRKKIRELLEDSGEPKPQEL